MALTLITGIQAAGKSTVAQGLAERLPVSVHVRGDAFRRMIVSGRADMDPVDPSPQALQQLHLRHELATEVADRYADAGFEVVLQDIILGQDLARVVERIRTRPLFVVVLIPDATAVAAREAGRRRSHGKVGRGNDEQGIAVLDAVLRSETPRVGMWIDTTALTVEETVEAIVARREREARVTS